MPIRLPLAGLLWTLAFPACLLGQSFVQISNGPGYSQQVFYRLSDDDTSLVAQDRWDLAFSTLELTDGGISINESTAFSMGTTSPGIRLFTTGVSDFAQALDTSDLQAQQYNDESAWTRGALNNPADPVDPLDYGWGAYNPALQQVVGDQVFVLQLRDGAYRKVFIESLILDTYTVRWAELDGANERSVTIAKDDFADSGIALLSLGSGQVLPPLPAWDLYFGRYTTPLDLGGGNLADYPVTGVLSGPGVQVAVAAGVDTALVEFADYTDSLSTQLDAIGYDWKTFDLDNRVYSIPDDLVYFVRTADQHLWKLVFVDFEGSSTGVSTFRKTDLGLLSAVIDPQSNVAEASLYPNPVVDEATLAFTLKEARRDLRLDLHDLQGRLLRSWRTDGAAGLNVFPLYGLDLPAGMYFLNLRQGSDIVTLKMIHH